MLLSRPFLYSLIYLYARKNDTRFDNDYSAVNNSSVTVAGQEGDISASLLEMKFPKAKTAHTHPTAQAADRILNVVTGKGDVTLIDQAQAQSYQQTNPNKIRRVKGDPISLLPAVIPLARGEYQLKNMIDGAINDLINDGTIAALLKKYEVRGNLAPSPDVSLPGGVE
jgi:ABC-type amino acid transport substrate-binding protein